MLGIEFEQPAHRLSRSATVSLRLKQQCEIVQGVTMVRMGGQQCLITLGGRSEITTLLVQLG